MVCLSLALVRLDLQATSLKLPAMTRLQRAVPQTADRSNPVGEDLLTGM